MKLTKSILFFSIIGLFMTMTTGVALVYHECDACGKEEIFVNNYLHLIHHESDGCCGVQDQCESSKIEDNCCKDSLSFIKLSDPFVQSFVKASHHLISTLSYTLTTDIKHGPDISEAFWDLPYYPPDIGIQPINILFCVFRI